MSPTADREPSSGVERHLAQAGLTIDLAAIITNWRALRERCASADCGAVVKADAYGTGMAKVAPALAGAGCKTFFVAQPGEALELRSLLPDDTVNIYVLNGLAGSPKTFAALMRANIKPVVGSYEDLQAFQAVAVSMPDSPGLAIQFSTGMNRIGFAPAEAGLLRSYFSKKGHAAPDFIMSHFTSSEAPDEPINQQQMARFDDIRGQFPGVAASLANSSGIFLPQAPHYELVRPGYALYGGNPCPGQANPMQTVVGLYAPVLQVREVAAGETAGYNQTWRAERPSRLAVIGVGYADGFPRSTSAGPEKPAANFFAEGTACPIAGRVSMDLIILDVTSAPAGAVQPGAPIEILGPNQSVDQLGEACGTIGYEILTGLGPRYHRQYSDG